MVAKVNVEVDPKKELQTALNKAAKETGDLTIPLKLIAQQWFKSNKAIFSLKGPGQYVDYKSDVYRAFKIRHLGSEYPMLRLTGKLEASITDPEDPDSVNYIVNRVSLALGTKVASAHGAPYAYYLHKGTHNMSARPVVLFGNEQVAPGSLNTRIEGWKKILLDYVMKKSKKNG